MFIENTKKKFRGDFGGEGRGGFRGGYRAGFGGEGRGGFRGRGGDGRGFGAGARTRVGIRSRGGNFRNPPSEETQTQRVKMIRRINPYETIIERYKLDKFI